MPSPRALRLPGSPRQRALGLAALLALLVSFVAAQVGGPEAVAPAVPPPPHKVTLSGAAAASWGQLTPAQQAALQPLQPVWGTISEAQRRKWTELAKRYPQLSEGDQQKFQARITEWIALSPQQRAQARLNFAETRKALTPQERQAKWQAYQALSEEERNALAIRGASKPPGTAPALRPVPARKLAAVPAPRDGASVAASVPVDKPTAKLAVAPHKVDSNTLLPAATVPVETHIPQHEELRP